jgi:hypothetical protein
MSCLGKRSLCPAVLEAGKKSDALLEFAKGANAGNPRLPAEIQPGNAESAQRRIYAAA